MVLRKDKNPMKALIEEAARMKNREEAHRQRQYEHIIISSNTIHREIYKTGEGDFQDIRKRILSIVMNGFVLWVLKSAQKQGVKRLYFLARDGYFMYQCSKIYCEKFQLPIECRYLSCSRYSVRIPTYYLDMETALKHICRGGIDVTWNKIVSRGGLNEEERKDILKLLGVWEKRKERIPYSDLEQVRRKLKQCPEFLKIVEEHSRKAYPAFCGYLKQEGLLEEKKAALVDSGWTGSMQKSLESALGYMGRKEKLRGYYWGLYELENIRERKRYHCYYFSPENGLRRKVFFSNCLFEAVFSAPTGMTMGYFKENKKFHPQYGPVREKHRQFMLEMERVLLPYTQSVAARLKSPEQIKEKEEQKLAEKLLRLFMGNPTPEEARIYGSLEFSDDILDREHQQVAVNMDRQELRKNHVWNKGLLMLGIRKGNVKESGWYEGSAVRYGVWKKYHLWMYRLYKYLLYMRKKQKYFSS